MKYLSGPSILDLAERVSIPRKVASDYMRSLSYRSAIEYAGAWGHFFTSRLGLDVRVTFSCDKWHVQYREPK